MIQLQFWLDGYGAGYRGDAMAPPSLSVFIVEPQAVETYKWYGQLPPTLSHPTVQFKQFDPPSVGFVFYSKTDLQRENSRRRSEWDRNASVFLIISLSLFKCVLCLKKLQFMMVGILLCKLINVSLQCGVNAVTKYQEGSILWNFECQIEIQVWLLSSFKFIVKILFIS